MAKLGFFGGHNGTNESGASGNGLNEKAVAKEAATIATNYAKRCGHTVINAFGSDINGRCNAANSNNVVGVLEFHTNAGGGQGAESFYCAGANDSKNLAQKTVNAGAIKGLKNRGVKPDTSTRFGRLGILRDTKASAVLHELFFIDSASDVKIWKANKTAIVESITAAFLAGLGLKSTPSGSSTPNKSGGGGRAWIVGDKVKVIAAATHYQTGEKIPSFVKGPTYKIKQIKSVNQSRSKRAYLLDSINSWVLEQDCQLVAYK
ncbi:N-acetylmuramoyl-L-alanine amidase [Listeria ilorinensis]|uniref:N-acetylmuramoyl-L-alanine amidase n=1 Tax=Listeria ilorinensis TaxID=2867439 RepID=UPI001EF59659|nr:N-acetylmuramoyl-L-alanine amidase [Listeria ilorinensis]